MGRIRQWIDRAAGATRAADRPAARRRPLGFERYESRIALSAATQTDWVADDDPSVLIWRVDPSVFVNADFFISNDNFERIVAFDLDDFVTLSTDWVASGWRPGLHGTAGVWNSPLLSQYALNDAAPGEGGLISLDSYSLLDHGTTGAALSASSQFVVTSAFGSDSDGGLPTNFVTFAEMAHHFIGTSGAARLHFADLTVDGSSPDSLGAAGAAETYVTSRDFGGSGFIRIVLPAPKADDEGGAIDLAAMLGPLGPAAVAGSGAYVAAAPRAAAAEASATVAAAAGDNLRARAIVYNVALIEDVASPNAIDQDDVAEPPAAAAIAPRVRATAPRPEPAERRATRIDPIPAPANSEQAAVELRVEPAPADAAPPSAAPAADETADAGAAVYDAAFGDWDDELAPLDADAGLSLAATRERTLVGLAVAAALGAPALIRRTRRPKATAPVEKAAGLR